MPAHRCARIARRVRNPEQECHDRRTLGERAADRDRLAAEVDHEVNVRAELAVRDIGRRLHRIEHALGVATSESHITDEPSMPL